MRKKNKDTNQVNKNSKLNYSRQKCTKQNKSKNVLKLYYKKLKYKGMLAKPSNILFFS